MESSLLVDQSKHIIMLGINCECFQCMHKFSISTCTPSMFQGPGYGRNINQLNKIWLPIMFLIGPYKLSSLHFLWATAFPFGKILVSLRWGSLLLQLQLQLHNHLLFLFSINCQNTLHEQFFSGKTNFFHFPLSGYKWARVQYLERIIQLYSAERDWTKTCMSSSTWISKNTMKHNLLHTYWNYVGNLDSYGVLVKLDLTLMNF